MKDKYAFSFALLLSSVFALASCASVHLRETATLFPEWKMDIRLPAGCSQEYLSYRTEEGNLLEAMYFHQEGAEANLIFFPGNEGLDSRDKLLFVKLAEHVKINLYVPNYRGYGFSEGKPDIEALGMDADAQFLHFIERTGGARVYVGGYSIGSYAALRIAAWHEVAGILLIAPFSTIEDSIKVGIGSSVPFPLRPFLKVIVDEKLRTMNNMAQIVGNRNRLFIVSSRKDELFPPFMAKKLLDTQAGEVKSLLEIDGVAHDDYLWEPGIDKWVPELANFISGR